MKTLKGIVVSDRMQKAAVVSIEKVYHHPLYKKILIRKGSIHAANEIGAKIGDRVEMTETKPIAKTITYKISKVIKEGKK